jgi:hypothetical protein
MRTIGNAIFLAVALLIFGGCSSTKKDGGQLGVPGSGAFANAPVSQGGKGGKSGSTTTGGGGFGPLASGQCAQGVAQGSHQTPRVVIVADGSCSMTTNYPADGRPDDNSCSANPGGRWAALRNSLIDPQKGVVPTLQAGVEFGLAVFGTRGTNGCPIPEPPVQPALNNLAAIQGGLPAVQPGMYTPTGPALDWVYANMFGSLMNGPDQHGGPQIVILMTDGQPNSCGNDMAGVGMSMNFQPAIDAVTKGAAQGIKTYVVSLAASSGPFHDFLQMIANIGAGGGAGTTAKLYEPTTPGDLSAALELLVGGAIGCDLALDGRVLMGQECAGQVTLNGKKLACNDPNGWSLPDPRHVRLQGTACDQVKQSATAMFEARFPCGVYMVQ